MVLYSSMREPRIQVEVLNEQCSSYQVTSNVCGRDAISFPVNTLHVPDDNVLSLYVVVADFVYDALCDNSQTSHGMVTISGDDGALMLAVAVLALNYNLTLDEAWQSVCDENGHVCNVSNVCSIELTDQLLSLLYTAKSSSDGTRIRAAAGCKAEAAACLNIYQHYILHSYASFEIAVPTAVAFMDRIRGVLVSHPWLLAIDASSREIVGYAYGSPHKAREAYQWCSDVSVYLHYNYRVRGVGRKLYDVLLPLLHHMGLVTLCAGIALPNEASLKLHESYAFQTVGVYRNVGYKLSEWRDVMWLQKNLLRDASLNSAQPSPPLTFSRHRSQLIGLMRTTE